MLLLPYLSVCFLFVTGFAKDSELLDFKSEESYIDNVMFQENKKRDRTVEVKMMKQEEVSHLLSGVPQTGERGLWGSSGGADTPFYYNFMKSFNGTTTITQCNSGGFSCIRFSQNFKDYFNNFGQDDLNKIGTFSTKPAFDSSLQSYTGTTAHLDLNSNKLSAYFLKFNDPEWRKQWHMQDYRTTNIPVMDHNVVPILNMGLTGEGVTIAILGEGITNHPDLGSKFDNSLSYDFCRNKASAYPEWRLAFDGSYYETDGVSNAGVIAMQAGNGICGAGIAPGVKIVGYKLNGCELLTDRFHLSGRALEYNSHIIYIYCHIWLNYDWLLADSSGNKLFVLSKTTSDILKTGTNEGRNNKGAIHIFPSGINRDYSNCATNGYLNNPYVITVASANQGGKPTSYSERCSAVFATTYSGDDGYEGIATINSKGQCSTYFKDRSAGPAIASGIIALLLEAKPSLTYRDVIHIIAMTAEVAPLADNDHTWHRNGRGFWVSSDFGFGLLNAENMVNLAKVWKGVSENNICLLRKHFHEPLYFDHTKNQVITLDGSICNGKGSDITYLEHVQLEITVDYRCRGAVNMNLTSPAGTNTKILEPRVKDCGLLNKVESYKGWNIMSVQNWGENPKGIWKISVGALNINGATNPHGHIHELVLRLQGTPVIPGNYPRKYAAFRLPNGKTNKFI